jgi:O-Antigen ligase
MRKSLLPEKYHTYVYIFALILLVIGMPLSKFLMSLSQIILVCNWILEGGLKGKMIAFKNNKAALILSSLVLVHFIGLLYTSDFDYAFKDIRIKAPLLILPLIFSTSKVLSEKAINAILWFFVTAILISTVISTLILTGVIHRELLDIRSVSVFISHIRFALLICIAVFISSYFFYRAENPLLKLLWVGIAFWLIYFLILTELMTGLAALCFAVIVLSGYAIFRSKIKWIKYSGVLVVSLIGIFIFYLSIQINKGISSPEKIDFSKLEDTTAHGNRYQHAFDSKLTENGHYIWIYFCNQELEEVWNKRSAIRLNEKDLKGNNIYFTLVRFLASKGLRKDADAVNSLSEEEIKAIEKGVVNVNYQDIASLEGRLHEIAWELDVYKNTGDPNGHSITQRFEFWKTALAIIRDNPVFGVGTGDIQKAFDLQYEKMNSPLSKDSRLRAHNQYLSIAVAFGIVGLVWFLITLFYPIFLCGKSKSYLYVSFLLIAIVSFLTEDTLETQAGVTFYAFFNSFLLFIYSPKKN